MTTLAEFFKRSHTTFDHPNRHLVAIFPSLALAQEAADKLQMAGFPRDETITASGKEIVTMEHDEAGMGSLLLQAVSRFFATEQKFVDHDIELARQGAGFLAVHCQTEENKNKAWKTLESEGPIDARYYALDGIEHLAGDQRTG